MIILGSLSFLIHYPFIRTKKIQLTESDIKKLKEIWEYFILLGYRGRTEFFPVLEDDKWRLVLIALKEAIKEAGDDIVVLDNFLWAKSKEEIQVIVDKLKSHQE